MATTNLNIRLDKDVKTQAEILFSELGLNMTSAITVFLKAAIREQGIPFPLRLETPADITLAAVEEGRRLLADPYVPRYSNMEDLKTALDQ